MIDLFLGPDTAWFGVPALVGTLFFALRLLMVVTGVDFGDGTGDGAGDGSAGGADGGDPAGIDEGLDHAESASMLRFLSLQSVTAFAMGFGYGGLLGLETFGYGMAGALGLAVLGGFGFAWVIVWCFKLMYSLESSGNVSIRSAVGCEGVTTSMIPAGGDATGRVRLTIRDRQRAFGARTEGEEIRMGSRVRVVRVNDDNTVTVVRA